MPVMFGVLSWNKDTIAVLDCGAVIAMSKGHDKTMVLGGISYLAHTLCPPVATNARVWGINEQCPVE
jgi:hypothetical protein